MTEEADSQEPTMEEILASIRRIISEDDDGGETAAAPEAEAVVEPESDAEEEDVLELTDMVMEEPEAEPEPEPVAEPESEEEIMDLAMAPEEELEAEPEVEPAAEDAFDAVVEEPEDDNIDFAMPEAAAVAEPEPEIEDVPEPVVESKPVSNNETLISGVTESATAAAFGALASSMAVSSGEGGTLEDLVSAMLRPMLKEWMDQNLAPLVEQMVREEIERVSRRGR